MKCFQLPLHFFSKNLRAKCLNKESVRYFVCFSVNPQKLFTNHKYFANLKNILYLIIQRIKEILIYICCQKTKSIQDGL